MRQNSPNPQLDFYPKKFPYPFPFLKKTFEQLLQWRDLDFAGKKGIIIGSNQRHENLLYWWWENYEKNSRLPVAVADFGMSPRMRGWCRNKGILIDCDVPVYILKNRVVDPPKSVRIFGKFMHQAYCQKKLYRLCFFKKPFALLKSPFEETIWVDVDCKIQGSLEPIFAYSDNPYGVSLALGSPKKHQQQIKWGWIQPGDKSFNSGVISYKNRAKIIQEWAAAVVLEKKYYYGDQNILTDLINKKQLTFSPLPPEYNWIIKERGFNPSATVLHYAGIDVHR